MVSKYQLINDDYIKLKKTNFYGSFSEPKTALKIKNAFAEYLGVDANFKPDINITQKYRKDNNLLEINGWSFVSIYGQTEQNELFLILDNEEIEIPNAIINKLPPSIKEIFPKIINMHSNYNEIKFLLKTMAEYDLKDLEIEFRGCSRKP